VLKFRKRRLLAAAALLVVLVLLWIGSSAMVAWKLTHRSRPPFAEPPPSVAWAKIEGLRLTTCDAQQIGGWLARGGNGKACVLLLHGNGGSRGEMLPVMRLLAEANYTSLAISLRAHGDSTGEVNDIGYSARHDVAAAVKFLRGEFPGRPVFVVGRSFGAAAAIFAAGELQSDVAGYFLEQPYKDLESAVWHRLRHHLPPVLDYVAYVGLRIWAPAFLPVKPEEISPYNHIGDIPPTVPVTIIAGSADRHAPLDDVKSLAGHAKARAKLVVFEGAKHEPLDHCDPGLYRASLSELLGRL
jgi:uncharacterized protein